MNGNEIIDAFYASLRGLVLIVCDVRVDVATRGAALTLLLGLVGGLLLDRVGLRRDGG